MKKEAGFTLVELLIVTILITIMSGVAGRLWIKMERMSSSVHQNMKFTAQSRILLDRMQEDIRRSIRVSRSEDTLLNLTQETLDGKQVVLKYRMDESELIRDAIVDDKIVQSMKIASLKNLFLEINFMKNETIRLQVRRRPSKRPMQLKNNEMTAFVFTRRVDS